MKGLKALAIIGVGCACFPNAASAEVWLSCKIPNESGWNQIYYLEDGRLFEYSEKNKSLRDMHNPDNDPNYAKEEWSEFKYIAEGYTEITEQWLGSCLACQDN